MLGKIIGFLEGNPLVGLCAVMFAAIVGLGIKAGYLNLSLKAERAGHERDIAIWRGAGIKAVADQMERVRATETRRAAINTETSDDYQRRMGAFLRAFTPGVRGQTPADHRGPGKADMPRLPYATSLPDGPGGDTVVSGDDARLCGIAILRLSAARDWALKQQGVAQ